MRHARAVAVAAALASCAPFAQAQDTSTIDSGWEVGLRWWWSRGKTQWNHDGSGVDPTAGNPASVLVYDKVDANALEIYGAKHSPHRWFISGNAGGGTIYRGKLRATDYAAGQAAVSDLSSSTLDGDLAYATLDGGYDFLRPSSRTSLGVFGGFNLWNERIVASGASFSLPAGTPDTPGSVAVIKNDVSWYSARLGLNGRVQLGDSFHFSATVAAVPRTWMRNKDSHYLRTDLGSTPNITMDGTGNGVQAEAEARYELYRQTEIALGVRYWKLRATGNVQFGGGPALPLNEFESTRVGATLSFITHW